ncbi:hypothetical protein AB0E08_06530 [Streptomyces sp. NPDC048281]|uniref:hypothetical protein n=1 Tax=Streptomyces sp. NPDC048281 TaxID=3154715 RepID=UPI003443FD64
MPSLPRLEEVTTANPTTALCIRVRPEQEQNVEPVADSLTEAYVRPSLTEAYVRPPGVARPHPIVDGDRTVGFLTAFLDTAEQGRGYGGFAVAARSAAPSRWAHWTSDSHLAPPPLPPPPRR